MLVRGSLEIHGMLPSDEASTAAIAPDEAAASFSLLQFLNKHGCRRFTNYNAS